MNRFDGIISNVNSSGSISIVDVECNGITFSSVVMETPSDAPYLKAENPIAILFKESEVTLAKNMSGEISVRNIVPSRVINLEKGEILSRVFLEASCGPFTAVITTRSIQRIQINPNDSVEALIKATEIILMEQTK
jgi:molybdopterin-binding protein